MIKCRSLLLLCFIGLVIIVVMLYYHPPRNDMTQAIIPRSQSDPSVKYIFPYTTYYSPWEQLLNFSECAYQNCKLTYDPAMVEAVDMFLFEFAHISQSGYPKVSTEARSHQYWTILVAESSAYPHNRFPEAWDSMFNYTINYRRTASIVSTMYGPEAILKRPMANSTHVDFAGGRTKGAFAYISNCESVGYDRIGLVGLLSDYIPVDLYGECGQTSPCERKDYECSKWLESQYRFALSFENSLCEDYITEKFWRRLSATNPPYIPIAMGGRSAEDYSRVAPPNSFIHVENFTNIASLGSHLKHLMEDDDAYNYYHNWRKEYVFKQLDDGFSLRPCELCRIVNERPDAPARKDLSSWWNDENTCKTFDQQRFATSSNGAGG